MQFQNCKRDGRQIFRWKQQETIFVFILNEETSEVESEMFHLSVAQCVYENAFKKPHAQATDEQLNEIMKNDKSFEMPFIANSDLTEQNTNLIENPTENFESEICDLYIFDATQNIFILHSERVFGQFLISTQNNLIKPNNQKIFRVIKENRQKNEYEQKINPRAANYTDRANRAFIWCHHEEKNVWTLCLRFSSIEALSEFASQYGEVVYELLKKEREGDGLSEDFVVDSFVGKKYSEELEDLEEESSELEDLEEEEKLEEENSSANFETEENQNISIGCTAGQIFVSRSNSNYLENSSKTPNSTIAVLQSQNGQIKTLGSLKTETAKIGKILLKDSDRRVLVSDKAKKSILREIDVPTGKITGCWDIKTEIVDMVGNTKNSQKTPEESFITIGQTGLYRIDPRCSDVVTSKKEYKTKMGLSCVATTASGNIAVGTSNGSIKLFNDLTKIAKTNIGTSGDEILAIDTTENGRYVLATCKTHLILIDTQMKRGLSGFSSRMGSEKPAPVCLTLKPEHVASMGIEVNFSPARFSSGQTVEKSIISSTGPIVVTWNFRRIKAGHFYDYRIRTFDDVVIVDNFAYGDDGTAIVAFKDRVSVTSTKQNVGLSKSSFLKPVKKFN